MDHSVLPPEDLAKGNIGDKNALKYSRLLLNATMKWAYPPVSLPKKEFMDRALQIWKEEKLPPLKLKEPWWGYSLGFWPAEDDEDAALAVRGDYKIVGEKLAKQRRKV
jgi:4-hydroxy-3-polyprenylbenzoate decarboxylase